MIWCDWEMCPFDLDGKKRPVGGYRDERKVVVVVVVGVLPITPL